MPFIYRGDVLQALLFYLYPVCEVYVYSFRFTHNTRFSGKPIFWSDTATVACFACPELLSMQCVTQMN